MNIPVPDPIPITNCGDGDTAGAEPPPKRARVEDEDVPAGTKVKILTNGTVKCNIPICDLIKIVKPVIRALVEDGKLFFNVFQTWSTFFFIFKFNFYFLLKCLYI